MAKNENQPVTKKELQLELKKLENRFESRMDTRFRIQDQRIDQKFREQDQRINQKFREQDQRIDTKFRAQNKSLTLRISLEVEREVKAAEYRLHQHFDKVLTKLDPLVGEIQNAREERAAISMRLANHEERLEKLESVVVVDKGSTTDAK